MLIDAPELAVYVTPKTARNLPIYNWFIYPHSYSPELVWRLIDDFKLTSKDQILDPFVGAATTLLAAKQRGISAVGLDLLPISATLAKAKISNYDPEQLLLTLLHILRISRSSRRKQNNVTSRLYLRTDGIVARAFDEHTFNTIVRIKHAILQVIEDVEYRAFYLTCLMSLLEAFSHTEKAGGWLKITDSPKRVGNFFSAFEARARQMISEVCTSPSQPGQWRVLVGDARETHPEIGECTAVITSPPYLNRHDYTRVLSLELLIGILDTYDDILPLRHQLLRSHVEAKPHVAEPEYRIPESLRRILDDLQERKAERRVLYITEGYFEDMYSVLKNSAQYLSSGSKLAFVLGNVRFSGLTIPVDEIMVELGNKLGLVWEKTLVARRRNNSAQQMRDFGRDPSKENVIIWQK